MTTSSDETLPVLTVSLFDRAEIEGLVFAALDGSVALVPVTELPEGATAFLLELHSPDRKRPLKLVGELAGEEAGGMCPMILRPIDSENADELLDFLGRQSVPGIDLELPRESSRRIQVRVATPITAPRPGHDPRRERSTPPPPLAEPLPLSARSEARNAITLESVASPEQLAELFPQIEVIEGRSALPPPSAPPPVTPPRTSAKPQSQPRASAKPQSQPRSSVDSTPTAPPPPDQSTRITVEEQVDIQHAITLDVEGQVDFQTAITLDVEGMDDIPAPPASSGPPSVINDPLLGRSLGGKYVISALIGAGGAGSVYRARHVMLQKDIAIKVMHPSLRKDPSFAERFHSEALAASKLDHPNVLRVLDFGEEPDGLLYIAMELLVGTELRALLWQGEMHFPRSLDIVCQICAALSAASEVGIVHRDIKPENVVITSSRDDEGNAVDLVKVCDFGLATIMEQDATTTSSGENRSSHIAGTPEYMSPEQVMGEELDGRSDIYAVGVLLYEMLTGRLPFEGTNPIEILKGHLRDPVVPPSKLAKDVDADVEAIVLRSLAKDRNQRPSTARELRAELRSVLERMRRPAPLTPAPPGAATEPLDDPGSGFGEMFVALTAALSRTASHDREHPEFVRALTRLVHATQTPLAGRGEIAIAQREAKETDLVVHTGKGESMDLRRAVPQSVADAYGPRFSDLFQRRHVVSLALKEGVSEADLTDAIELLSGDIAVDALRLDLLSRGLRGVSILFAEEMVGKSRKLPWSVDLCLSRIARDLRALPLMRGVTEEAMRSLRTPVIEDVVRGLERPEDVRLLLENADLVESSVQHIPEMDTLDLRSVIVNALLSPLAVGAAQLLVGAAARSSGPRTPLDPRAAQVTSLGLLAIFAARFLRDRTPGSDELLRDMQALNVVELADLPAEIQSAVAAEHLATAMVDDPELMYKKLAAAPDLTAFAAEMASITRALTVLAKAGDARTVAGAVTGLVALALGASPGESSREELAAGALASLGSDESLAALAEALLFGPVPQREPARTVLGLLGGAAARALLAARVKGSGVDPFPRPRFVAALREVGRAALPAIAEHISRIDPEGDESSSDGGAAFAEDLLRSLPDAPDEHLGRAVARFLRHRAAPVRRAAAASLTGLLGHKAKPTLMHALDDVDEGVRAAAFAGLRAVRGIDETVVQRVDLLLNGGLQASDELRAGAAGALAEVREGAKPMAVDVLLRAMKPKSRSIVSLFKAADDNESVLVLTTVGRVLLSIGGPDARKEIEKRASSSRGELKKALSDLLGLRS